MGQSLLLKHLKWGSEEPDIRRQLTDMNYRIVDQSLNFANMNSEIQVLVYRLGWTIVKSVVKATKWLPDRPLLTVIGPCDKILLVGYPDEEGEFWTLAINPSDGEEIAGRLSCLFPSQYLLPV